jgi:GR25 family glycosyltransferase involved in LPS biosynthesis
MDIMDRLDYLSPFFIPIAPYSAIGCAVSHMKVWETFLERSEKPYKLVLEDDVILTEGFKENLDSLLHEGEKTWDLMHLGCFGSK